MGNRKKKFVSLFAGIGGLDAGFSSNGWLPVYVNENHRNTALTYEKIHGHPVDMEDILQVDCSSIPDSDLIVGGPPCQSFSLVGRRNADDPRGKLVYRFVEIVLEKKPASFVMENVPGILCSTIDGVKLIDHIELLFKRAGYFVERVKVVATDYGVPQKRQRVVLIGSLTRKPKLPTSDEFFERMGIDKKHYSISSKSAIGDLSEPVCKGESASYRRVRPSLFAQLMRQNGPGYVRHHEMPRMSERDSAYVRHIPPGGNYQHIPDSIATPRVLHFKRTGGRTTTYGRLHPDQPSYTINTAFRRPNVGCNFHYEQDRLITPREAMRFQSMPDHWELVYTAQDERNMMIGNAVPPLLASALRMAVEDSL